MAVIKSGNPALSRKTFEGLAAGAEPMTLPGTVNRAAMLLAILLIGAGWVWNVYAGAHDSAAVMPYALAGVLGGFVLAMVTIFVKTAAPWTSPLYALLEGFAIGSVSVFMEQKYPGIAMQAAGLTFGVAACMLVAYRTGLIRATARFKLGLVAATGAIAVLYLVDLVLMLFGMPIKFIHEGGTMGVLFSLVVVGIAALNLIMDFDFIEQGVAGGAPKYMEWYAAFGLLVTLVWLYLEILRLLAKRR